MGTEQFSLKWNNHTRHLVGVFESLLQAESLVDVTLSCEGQSLKAHKLVLSACSPYFKTLFQDHSEAHPIVILKGK
ncbi:Protein tramtrack, beta isoform [Amphibalanus amphitrite]|uniref:Protein tramtrack, beta isoform n=1 Tax=Amphibalanus amphitrite TaxID=1232801 RepID=A0A6A4VL09_AMPAM|nr:Protein tramtrack, beta isoform [Amphibalanus amphitrite]